MSIFQDFFEKYGEGESCLAVEQKIIDHFSPKLPETLIQHWQEQGWCSYAQGLIWTVNPLLFESTIQSWFGKKSKKIVIARTGFGQLYVWTGEGIEFVHTTYGGVSEVAKDVRFLFNFGFCDKKYLRNALDQPLFNKALKKLGPLSSEECFGFEPVLSLGGSGKLNTIRKYNLKLHLDLLAQINSSS